MDIIQYDKKFRYAGVSDDYIKLSAEDFVPIPPPSDLPVIVNRKRYLVRTKTLEHFPEVFRQVVPEFGNLNYEGLIISGGFILYLLDTEYPDSEAFRDTDIDIFIYHPGKDEKFANSKIKHITELLSGKVRTITSSSNAVTFYLDNIKIQIILRLYVHPSEVLHGFDLGPCSIGFDGKNLYSTSFGLYCLKRSINIVDVDRKSTTYESRLVKYFLRGFGIVCPFLDIEKLAKKKKHTKRNRYNTDSEEDDDEEECENDDDGPGESSSSEDERLEMDDNAKRAMTNLGYFDDDKVTETPKVKEVSYKLESNEKPTRRFLLELNSFIIGGIMYVSPVEIDGNVITGSVSINGQTQMCDSDYDYTGLSGRLNAYAVKHAKLDNFGMWQFDEKYTLVKTFKDLDSFKTHHNLVQSLGNPKNYQNFFDTVRSSIFNLYDKTVADADKRPLDDRVMLRISRLLSFEPTWKIYMMVEQGATIKELFERQKEHTNKIFQTMYDNTVCFYWKKNNPGSQFTGSFKPIKDTEERWYGELFNRDYYNVMI